VLTAPARALPPRTDSLGAKSEGARIATFSSRTWGKLTLGTLTIGGILVGLWATRAPQTVEPASPHHSAVPRLAAADAAVRVREGSHTRRASISCHGDRIRASGFWATDAADACDALASTRLALLSGPGCPRIAGREVGITVTGSFGARRFAHRAVRGGCPDPDGWLAVDVLAAPVLKPDQELEDAWSIARPSGLAPGLSAAPAATTAPRAGHERAHARG
jgi:hypothetical protein